MLWLRTCDAAKEAPLHALFASPVLVFATAPTSVCNAGVGGGGAMSAYNMTGIMSLAGDTFSNNSATTQGGILAVTDSPSFAITITNSTVTDNTVRS